MTDAEPDPTNMMKRIHRNVLRPSAFMSRLLMLSVGAYILNALMWLFIDGDIGMDGDFAENVGVVAVSMLLIVILTAVSMACMWGLTRLFPPSYERPWQLVAYGFAIFLLNNVIATAYAMLEEKAFHIPTSELELIKDVFCTAMSVSFVTFIYFCLQFQQSYIRLAKKSAALEKRLAKEREERLQSQVSLLMMQISPHFMFNNFSILSELIVEDQQAAEAFLKHLSKVYRYVIQNAERTAVSVEEEMLFLDSYLTLIRLRYGGSVSISVDDQARHAQGQLPPVSLQLLVENAIKHNKRSQQEPLRIDIYVEEVCLVVGNDLRPVDAVGSTHVGQDNIRRRYELLGTRRPEFIRTETEYVARLPILPPPCNQ